MTTSIPIRALSTTEIAKTLTVAQMFRRTAPSVATYERTTKPVSETEYVVKGTDIIVVRVTDQRPSLAGMRLYKRSGTVHGMWLKDDEVEQLLPKKKPRVEKDFHILRFGQPDSSKGWFVKECENNWTWLGDGCSVPATHFRWDYIVNNENIHWPEGY